MHVNSESRGNVAVAEHFLNGLDVRPFPHKVSEEELKAAIKSAWKKLERIGKKEVGPLLYWLREKLRAQGSRNDLRDQDKGFGAWVEKTIEISRRTADLWADEYGLASGPMKRKPTSRHDDQKLFSTEEDDFYSQELRKHGRQIQMNYWVRRGLFQKYESAVKILERHFKTTSSQEAVVKGAWYASEILGSGTARSSLAQKANSCRLPQCWSDLRFSLLQRDCRLLPHRFQLARRQPTPGSGFSQPALRLPVVASSSRIDTQRLDQH